MRLNRRSRRILGLQRWLMLALGLALVGLLAWLSLRYSFTADWTREGRHTLSEASLAVLAQLDDPLEITAYARPDPELRGRIQELVGRYQRARPDVTLRFVNPDLVPDELRARGISVDGELLLRYQGRSENLRSISEQEITNALQRLARGGERWVAFLEGHGERRPSGAGNHDLGLWVRQLEQRGLKARSLNLAVTAAIPDNAALLVIAGPQVEMLPAEVGLVREYVERGGNLLWLADPGPLHGLESLAEDLGVSFLPGTVVDPTTQLLGIDSAAMVLIPSYPAHPALGGFRYLTVFPYAWALEVEPPEDWHAMPLLVTAAAAWSETGPLEGSPRFDDEVDVAGPLTLGISLTRSRPDADGGEQRIVVIGDGDFLSNAYLGNSGNLDLGLRLVNWLSGDDAFVVVPARGDAGVHLELSRTATAIIGFGFLLVIPLLLAGVGAGVWLRRRRG